MDRGEWRATVQGVTSERLSVSVSFLEAWGDRNLRTGGVRSPLELEAHCRAQTCVCLRDRGER